MRLHEGLDGQVTLNHDTVLVEPLCRVHNAEAT
jgi:hypothetical protein